MGVKGLHSIRLCPGETSRLVGESVRKVIDWALYVCSRLDIGGQLQVHPTEVPKQGRTREREGEGEARARTGLTRLERDRWLWRSSDSGICTVN